MVLGPFRPTAAQHQQRGNCAASKHLRPNEKNPTREQHEAFVTCLTCIPDWLWAGRAAGPAGTHDVLGPYFLLHLAPVLPLSAIRNSCYANHSFSILFPDTITLAFSIWTRLGRACKRASAGWGLWHHRHSPMTSCISFEFALNHRLRCHVFLNFGSQQAANVSSGSCLG